MDNKRLIIGMLVAMAIVFGWSVGMRYLSEKYHWYTPEQQQAQTAQQKAPAQTQAAAAQAPVVKPAGPEQTNTALRVIEPAAAASDTMLGSATKSDPNYSLGVETNGRGASISQIVVNEFPRDVNTEDRYVFQKAPEGTTASMATAWIQVNGQRVDLAGTRWHLASHDQASATYTIDIGAAKPMVRVSKTFALAPKSDTKEPTHGYQVTVTHRIENLTNENAQVVLGMAGPIAPPPEIERGPDRFVIAGYNDDQTYPQIKPTNWGLESLKGDKATVSLEKSKDGWPMIWAGTTSTYFDALVLPVGTNPKTTAEYIGAVQAKSVDPNADPAHMQVDMLFTTKPLQVAGGKTAQFDLQTFFGPKARDVIKNSYYGQFPRQYDVTLNTSGSCAWCTFSWLVNVMVALLGALHWVFHDWGLSIIGLVVIVRVLMHPLTRNSTIAMNKMQKMAPEMERIKKKYADDPAEQQRQLMAFQKQYAPGMALGCLPMFIQMPIWIALWQSLGSTFELRLAPFLWGYTWVKDLARPDHLITFAPISIFGFFTLNALNLLPILLAGVTWFQQKMTPKPPTMTPEQQQQQRMTQWMMIILLPLMFYNGPSGLVLYMLTSNALAMIEMKIIRDHIKAREAAEAAAGPVIIDAPATRVSRRRHEDDGAKPEAPKTGIAGWFARLQEMAEQARQQAEQQKKNKK